MDKRQILLHPPVGGVNERYSFQNQAPYTTPSSTNCRNDSWTVGGRERMGSRPGLAKAFALQLGSGNPVKLLDTVDYSASNAINVRVAAISNTNFYVENPVGTMALHTATAVTGTGLLHSAQLDQVLYIADYVDATATTVVPKTYTPATGVFTGLVSSAGSIPNGCPLIASWRGRLVLAGGTTNPNGVFLSAQGDATNWDYSVGTVDAAVSLALSNAGKFGDVITCLSPHGDNCMILGGATSLWIFRGDPSYGDLHNLSSTFGVIDKGAWCKTPEGIFVFLSQDGLYMVPAGCEAAQSPVSLSRERLPTQLLATDKTTTTVAMAYDVVDRGIHIFLTPNSAGSTASGHWFFDWETKSFWKVTLGDTDFEPFAIHSRRNWYTTNSGTLLGCRDGYIRYHSHSAEDDDGTDFASEVWLGPFGDPSMMNDTLIAEISATLATSSGQVGWEIYSANSPEEAYASEALYRGDWSFGRNNAEHPRVRGQSLYLRLFGSEDGVAWAWEAGYAVIGRVGRIRP